MKKTMVLVGLCALMSANIYAQGTIAEDSIHSKSYGSILWGLHTWGEKPKADNNKLSSNPSDKPPMKLSTTDTTQYEVKSILWGAVQWTQRKNETDAEESSR